MNSPIFDNEIMYHGDRCVKRKYNYTNMDDTVAVC